MADEVRRATPPAWVDAVRGARAEGYAWFDLLTCVDELGRQDALRVVVRLERRDGGGTDGVRIEVLLDRSAPQLATLGGVFSGATWREREVADFFGVAFTDGDPRPLLARPDAVGHVLRKDAVLAARVVTPWPGGREPGDVAAAGRRRAAAAGVPDPAIWGEREGEPASPAEVAASVAGRRSRR